MIWESGNESLLKLTASVSALVDQDELSANSTILICCGPTGRQVVQEVASRWAEFGLYKLKQANVERSNSRKSISRRSDTRDPIGRALC